MTEYKIGLLGDLENKLLLNEEIQNTIDISLSKWKFFLSQGYDKKNIHHNFGYKGDSDLLKTNKKQSFVFCLNNERPINLTYTDRSLYHYSDQLLLQIIPIYNDMIKDYFFKNENPKICTIEYMFDLDSTVESSSLEKDNKKICLYESNFHKIFLKLQ